MYRFMPTFSALCKRSLLINSNGYVLKLRLKIIEYFRLTEKIPNRELGILSIKFLDYLVAGD